MRRVLDSEFLRDTGVLTLAGFAVAVITIIQGVLVARWLGPIGYGIVAIVSAYPAVALSLLSPDSPHATVRYLADREAAGDRQGALAVCKLSFAVDLTVGVVAFLVVAVSAPWAQHHVVHSEGTASLLILTGAALMISAPAGAMTSVLMHARRFGLLAIEQVATAGVRSVLVVASVAAEQGATGAVRAAALGQVIHGVAIVWLGTLEARRQWDSWWLKTRTRHLASLRREMLRFMAWTDLGATLGAATKQLDIVILGWIGGPAEAGIYRLARSVAALPGYVVGPLQTAVYPRLAAQWVGRERSEFGATIRRHAAFGAALAGAGLIGILALPPVVNWIAGPGYTRSGAVGQVLTASTLVWLACYWLRPAYMAIGDLRTWFTISTGVVVASLAGFIPAAAAWGALGLAVVQLAAAIGGHVLGLAHLRRSFIRSNEGHTAAERLGVIRS
jgi:O-antigen/teichoic acid export membrane protein